MSAELPTRWAAGRARALGLCQGSLQGSPWPGNLGAGWGWECAGSVGSPLPVGAANHTLGSTEALLQSLTPHPFSQEKLRLRQVARLGLAGCWLRGPHPSSCPMVPVFHCAPANSIS